MLHPPAVAQSEVREWLIESTSKAGASQRRPSIDRLRPALTTAGLDYEGPPWSLRERTLITRGGPDSAVALSACHAGDRE